METKPEALVLFAS
jgi:sulfite reductase alpha subunit-like flavoprotein